MSMITSLVVVVPVGWAPERIERLGRALYAVPEQERRGRVPYEGGYDPIPAKMGDVYLANGPKVPGGTIWWLGMNYLNLEHLLAELDAVEEFHGVWVWAEPEYCDEPITHRVGG